MPGPDALAARLSARASDGAQVSWLGEMRFGERLTLNRWRFGNGLLLLTLRDTSAPVISYQSWFGVGSRHEEEGKTGLAHFFEHLMFGETKRVAHGEFDVRLEEVGAENNAATWTDWTYYYENLPASELELVVELEADRMRNLVLRKGTVASEREVVSSERRDRVEDDVDGMANEVLWRKALGKHPYGHPTLGWMRDIERFSVADCKAFYKRWYAPNNLVLSVAGDFEERHLLELVQAAYGAMSSSRLPATKASSARRRRREQRAQLRLPAASERLLIAYPAPGLGDLDWTRLALLGDVLFSGRSSRLYRRMILEDEIATSVWGDVPPFALPSIYQVGITMRAGKSSHLALELLDEALELLSEELVSEDELERARNRLELSLLSQMETASGKADQMGFYQSTLGEPAAVFDRLQAYREVTPEDLRLAARRYFETRSRTVLEVLPG